MPKKDQKTQKNGINGHLSAEDKYIGSSVIYDRIQAVVRHFCRPDRQYPRNRVCSIYFDTPAHAAFNEKANGDFLKQKIRLRWYELPEGSGCETVMAFLEVKDKVGGVRSKERHGLQLDRHQLLNRTLRVLEDHYREVGLPSPGRWRPSIQVDYLRDRFECPVSGARVCIDFQIAGRRINPQMLAGSRRVGLDTVVVEIKGVHKPDTPWLKHLYASGLRAASFSKYGACFAQISGDMTNE